MTPSIRESANVMGLEEREMSSNGRLRQFQRVNGVRGRDRNLTITDAFTHCASCEGIGARVRVCVCEAAQVIYNV